MISTNSRYIDSVLVTQPKLSGNQTSNTQPPNILVITPSQPVNYTFNFVFYVVHGADRIDTLAYDFYGDPTKWWVIADANPEVMNWFNLSEGMIIRIPNA